MLDRITRQLIINSRSLRRQYKAFTLVSSILLIALIVGLMTVKMPTSHVFAQASATPTPTPPDYSKIGNAMAGVTHVMKQDDVIVNIGAYTSVNNTDFYPSSISSITTAGSNGTQNFDGFEIPQVCDSCSYDTLYYTQDSPNVVGRFFHTVTDTLVSYPSRRFSQDLVDIMTGTVNGNKKASFYWNASQPLPYGTNSATKSQGIAADFNQDGYDDLLMLYSDHTARFSWNMRMRIATAVNVNDPSQGFNFGTESQPGVPDAILGAAVGDFNGDGQPDIATAAVGTDNGLSIYIFSVDPQTLNITFQKQITPDTLVSDSQSQPIQLAAGNFTGSVNQQLVLASPSGTNNYISLRVFDFDQNSYLPVLKKTWNSGAVATNLKLITSKYDWGSPYDVITLFQAVIPAFAGYLPYVRLFTVDPNDFTLTNSAIVDVVKTYGLVNALDIAVGNFNAQKPDPADPSKMINDPNLYLAVATATNSSNTSSGAKFNKGRFNVIRVIDPDSGNMSLSTVTSLPLTPQNGNDSTDFNSLSINAADLQGRSLRLGGGIRFAVDKKAPSIIIPAPPMHVDYLIPAQPGATSPTVVNFSLAPDGYFTEYETDSSEDATNKQTNGSSMSFSSALSIGGSFAAGEVNDDGSLKSGVKVSDTLSARFDLNKSTDKTYGEYSSTGFSLAQKTGLADYVWYDDTTYYFYIYEVIGQTVCPDGQATCDDSARVPMTLMFSGSTTNNTTSITAQTLEWYQPLWQVGNVFSYPGNYGQLQSTNPNLDSALSKSNTFYTDDATAVSSATIVDGGNSETQVTSSRLFSASNDLNVQVAGSGTLPGANIGTRWDFDTDINISGSKGISSLTDSDNSISSTTRMTVNKGVSFPTPSIYAYGFTPTFFGEVRPVGFADNYGVDYTNHIRTYGPLRSAFTVNLSDNNVGSFWGQAYKVADVGLNHPVRWSSDNTSPNPTGLNCVDAGTVGYKDCAKMSAFAPRNPWMDTFHDMRGFFISPASTPGQGPQLEQATAGDQLWLQARVYNNSFAPANNVHVRIYGMKWNLANNVPADATVDTTTNPPRIITPGGSSFLIGEKIMNIPGFSSETNAPLNSVLAGVNFDTTPYGDTDLVFWVAVWMEDGSGNLAVEPNSKGLTALPGNLATFLDATNLEPIVNNPSTDSIDPATVSFSDNIGFYKKAFYIAQKTAASSASARPRNLMDRLHLLDKIVTTKVDVVTSEFQKGQATEVFAILRNDGEAIDGISVYFYDGDPAAGGQLFDVEQISHIRAGAIQKVNVPYRPKECGLHDLYIKVTAVGGGTRTIGKAERSLNVECPTPVCAAQTCLKAAQYYALHPNSLPRGQVTVAGTSPINQVNTSDAGRMSILLQGGGAAAQKFNQQFVALQLSLLAANDPSRQTEKSNLLCYRVNFQPVQLGTGFTLNPSMTIGELLAQARIAARSGNAIDQRTLANLMNLLNGDDPSGRCR